MKRLAGRNDQTRWSIGASTSRTLTDHRGFHGATDELPSAERSLRRRQHHGRLFATSEPRQGLRCARVTGAGAEVSCFLTKISES